MSGHDLSALSMVSQNVQLDMAEEKVLQDPDMFTDWLTAECMDTERRPSDYFHPISTASLIAEILMARKVTDEQIAAGWKLIRARYLEDNQALVMSEFNRLRAEEERA